MPMMDCRDILDAVYNSVKDFYIAHFYSAKVKSRTVNENTVVDESLKTSSTSEPVMESETNNRESDTSTSETVREELERTPESEIMLDIRMELEAKMPYALATVCANLACIDRLYREWKGYDEQQAFSEFYLTVGDDFPLSERFAYPCTMFVSSMMLIDIDEAKSDAFYEKYATLVTQIVSEIPMKNGAIVEKYPY